MGRGWDVSGSSRKRARTFRVCRIPRITTWSGSVFSWRITGRITCRADGTHGGGSGLVVRLVFKLRTAPEQHHPRRHATTELITKPALSRGPVVRLGSSCVVQSVAHQVHRRLP